MDVVDRNRGNGACLQAGRTLQAGLCTPPPPDLAGGAFFRMHCAKCMRCSSNMRLPRDHHHCEQGLSAKLLGGMG